MDRQILQVNKQVLRDDGRIDKEVLRKSTTSDKASLTVTH